MPRALWVTNRCFSHDEFTLPIFAGWSVFHLLSYSQSKLWVTCTIGPGEDVLGLTLTLNEPFEHLKVIPHGFDKNLCVDGLRSSGGGNHHKGRRVSRSAGLVVEQQS